MGHFGTTPVHPVLPMVQWDGMNPVGGGKWDTLVQPLSVQFLPWYNEMGWTVGTGHSKGGTLWYNPCPSSPSHGTMGWDGQ